MTKFERFYTKLDFKSCLEPIPLKGKMEEKT